MLYICAHTGAVVVPRSRFAPVKTCGDLLLLRSDCYMIAEDATVQAAVQKVSAPQRYAV